MALVPKTKPNYGEGKLQNTKVLVPPNPITEKENSKKPWHLYPKPNPITEKENSKKPWHLCSKPNPIMEKETLKNHGTCADKPNYGEGKLQNTNSTGGNT